MIHLLASAPGCDTTCTGPGCDEAFGAGLLVAWSPLAACAVEGDWRLLDALGAGTFAALAGDGSMVLAGQPEADAVALLDPRTAVGDLLLGDLPGRLVGDGAGQGFGTALAHLAGEGRAWVGAPARSTGTLATGAGAVMRFDALDPAAGERAPDLVVQGDAPMGALGTSLAGCGDLDGDGEAEILAGAPGSAGPGDEALAGAVVLVRSTDLAGAPSPVGTASLPAWTGPAEAASLGRAVACADLDGDGVDDPVLAAPFAEGGDGRIEVLAGADLPAAGPVEAAAAWTLSAPVAGGWLGASLATGDWDGDGRPDLAAGLPGALDGAGAVAVWDGAAWPEGPRYLLEGRTPGDHLGTALASGDLDGDGVDDLLAGAPRADGPDGATDAAGLLAVVFGAEAHGGRSGTLPVEAADILLDGTVPYLQLGGVLAVAAGKVLAGLAVQPGEDPPACPVSTTLPRGTPLR